MSEKDEPLTPKMIANLDQLQAHLVNLGRMLGEYHNTLVKSKIPDALAHDLVRDYHMFLISQMGKATNVPD